MPPRTPSKPLVGSNLHRLLRNAYYKGTVRYRGVEYHGSHKPLVDVATWDQVQALLDAQNLAGAMHRVHPHYLKGSVFCGSCGSRLVVSKNRGRRGKLYEYFVCLGRGQRRTACTQRAVLISRVEQLAEDHYFTVQPNRVLLTQIRTTLTAEIERRRREADGERQIAERQISRLQAERTKMLEAYYAGALPLDVMRSEQQRIAAAMTSAGHRLEALTSEFDVVRNNLDRAVDVGRRLASRLPTGERP